MCGIAGIFKPEGVTASELQQLSTTLRHRGPDDEGFCVLKNEQATYFKGTDTQDELAGLPAIQSMQEPATGGLVHRRLSILDLSIAGHQPMSTADSRYTIIFNGEVYNYKEIRIELEALGKTFKSGTDTEVILQAYAEWGEVAVQKFIGMWAFAIHDNEKNELFISRDRFGIKPLYYAHSAEGFAFASEIKALLELEMVSRKASTRKAVEFFAFGTLCQPYDNLFEDVKELPPGHNLIFDISGNRITTNCYYDLEKAVEQCPLNTNPKQQWQELFAESVSLHLRSDVPVGSCLSGGLDSSAIVTFSAPQATNDFHTFTAAYKQADIDESNYAALVSNSIPNVKRHLTYPNAQTFLNDLEKIIWHQDLPIGSPSIYAQWEVMKLAAENNMKVLLDGQGSDEALGGYYNFAGIHLIELLKRLRLMKYLTERKLLKQNFTPDMKSAFRRAAYYFLPGFAQRAIRAKERIGASLIADDYSGMLDTIALPSRGGKTFREHSLLSFKFGLYELLRYEDRNSMAFSIESRVPFLDHRLVELSIALPNEEKIKEGWTKYMLRKTLENKLPKEVVWRKDKMGFLTPMQAWKDEVSPILKAFFADTQIPEFLDKVKISQLCDTDFDNNWHLAEFWRAFAFLKWAEIHKVEW